MLEKMDVFFENRLSDYDEHMLTTIEGADDFYKYTAARLPMESDARVLDLGCGTGLELEKYFLLNPGAHITGIDLSKGMLETLAAKFPDKKLDLICESYFDADLGVGQYDAAVSVESLHHFTSKRKLSLYQKLIRALKPGGYFVLTDYFAESEELEKEYFRNLEILKKEQNITDNGFYHYDTPLTAEHEVDVLKDAGFTNVSVMKRWGATYTIIAK
ncbi:MAG: class I SAM-dependent methyltransferase [Eubacterium sp.]|nr:class I SAM-dependent methyltransferase [Eubacterium sp.]